MKRQACPAKYDGSNGIKLIGRTSCWLR
ncbi:hypothetical protein CGLO_14099 [Colletotrichum gloeosporioides Cg-14]|uniref:Uncharacterized protein n=1 Tax=Colletotrichum gloeosporioides (strain Cg-14) TaxID=1237896 RepID=T0K270_COLGC|nr:hypothetical protein CGLO_14099 [Colletotrichum gloeosporioides Cg-14]